jgi:hypothetical protein
MEKREGWLRKQRGYKNNSCRRCPLAGVNAPAAPSPSKQLLYQNKKTFFVSKFIVVCLSFINGPFSVSGTSEFAKSAFKRRFEIMKKN